MPETLPTVRMTLGKEVFCARLRFDRAPRSCDRLIKLLPYRGELIHAQWSGQACWSPLASQWPLDERLSPENAIAYPSQGDVLLFGGDLSEPELLIAYGPCRFASMAGTLAGNPVLAIQEGLPRLAELGRQVLWHGAVELRIELTDAPYDDIGSAQRDGD
jgi:Protein of unknown function (DUF3830)